MKNEPKQTQEEIIIQLRREGKLFWIETDENTESVIENGTYILRKKETPKPTGKQYNSLQSLMNGEGIDKSIVEKVWRKH